MEVKTALKEKYGFARTDSNRYFNMILTDQLGRIDPVSSGGAATMSVNRKKAAGVNAGIIEIGPEDSSFGEVTNFLEFIERRTKEPED